MPTTDIQIVSDVMCPWCYVGYMQLEQALLQLNISANIEWHPFELNPETPPEGLDFSQHILQKYGIDSDRAAQNRKRLTAAGSPLGIDFQFGPGRRLVNTFPAHQLLEYALGFGLQHPLKLSVFEAYFTDGRDVSDHEVLTELAVGCGLEKAGVLRILETNELANLVRQKQQVWTTRGISGVPSMIFSNNHLITGALGIENYKDVLRHAIEILSQGAR